MSYQLLWEGSSKDVLYDESKGLIFDFSDRVSVFDLGPLPRLFPGLGELRCTIASRLFSKLNAAGFETHFQERLTDTQMLVTPYDIPEKSRMFKNAAGRLLPLELLFRFAVTPKLFDRITAGSVDVASVERLLGSTMRLQTGARLHPAFVECSTKHQGADTYVSDSSAAALAGIDEATLRQIYGDIQKAADFLKTLFHQAGFELQDGKIEGALLQDGTFVIADAISPDELRLTGNNGKSYDKDPVRQWYADALPTWVMMVNKAKKRHPDNRKKWPSYTQAPPDDIAEELIKRYRAVADALIVR